MRKIYLLGVALCAVLVSSAVAGSAALAVETASWLIGGTAITLATEPVHVEILAEGHLLLWEDMKAPGTPDFECEPEGLGFLYSNGEDLQETYACRNPVDKKGTCAAGSIRVEYLNLPWLTQLLEPNLGVFVDDLTAGTGGNPGWLVECTVLGIKVTDTCTTANGKTNLKNLADGLVEVEFPEVVEKSEQANCTLGGAEEGLVAGIFFLHALDPTEPLEELATLAVSLAPEQAHTLAK